MMKRFPIGEGMESPEARYSRYVKGAMKSGLSGAASGRAAKLEALDEITRRRAALRASAKGSSGGKIRRGTIAPTEQEIERGF